MTLAQKVGQLLMVDCPSTGIASATVTAIRGYHVGSVILDGTTTQGVAATAAVTGHLRGLAPPNVGLLIATDQEGGLVQRLQGPGFSAIPSALQQSKWSPQFLQHAATIWGQQLRQAGVNVNLAPVLDTVPRNFGSNPPIGNLDREYGHLPIRVTRHGLAFAAGMRAAGVDATGKHFPGLGRVRGNTDTSSGVTDPITTRHARFLRPFAAAARAGFPFIMVGTAIYSRIDPGVPAAFSRTIVTGMLRDDLGYQGVIISDDVGAAAQVSGVPVGMRAVRFVGAGGDIVLTVNAAEAGVMTHALIARARTSNQFRARVNAAALTVLRAKQAAGLLR
jgi:beta-N-acetylhexosaminidase